MSGKTPGQAAYDAWWATAEGVPATPDVTYDQDAEAWEAAAEAGSGKLRAECDRLRAELAEVNGYHGELLDEILLNAGDKFDRDEAADVIAVRYVRHLEQRAGLTPELVTAGTDHIARQLLDPKYPDGPAWQRVRDMQGR